MVHVFIRPVAVHVLLSLFVMAGCGSSNDDTNETDQLLGSEPSESVPQPGPMAPVSSMNETPSGTPADVAPAPEGNTSAMDQDPVTSMASPADPPVAEPTDQPPGMEMPEDQPVENSMESNPQDETMRDDEPLAEEMQPDGNADRPDYPMGPSDIIARRACALLDEEAQEIQVVGLEGEAGQVLLTPQPQTRFSFTIPEAGFGFVTLEVPDWAITIAAFSHFEQTVTILDPDGVTEEIIPLSWNGACPEKGLTDHRTKYHSWGSFTVKVEGEPNTEMTLSFIKQN